MHDNELIIHEHEVSRLGLGSNNDPKVFRQCTLLKESFKGSVFNQNIFKYIEKSSYFTLQISIVPKT